MLPEPFSLIQPKALSAVLLMKDGFLFSRNQPVTGIYFLTNGEIRLCRNGEDGTEIVIHRAFSGESFAEASLFSNVYHCDAIAVTQCELIRIDKPEVLKQLEINPVFATLLTRHLARQVQSYRRLIELRSIKIAETRVYTAIQEGISLDNIKAFASQIGLTHETTYRSLSQLVRKNKLNKTGRGTYVISASKNKS